MSLLSIFLIIVIIFIVTSRYSLTNVSGDIVPSVDSLYNLGSPEKRFKDLYLFGGSINIIDTVTNVPCVANLNNGLFIITAAEGQVQGLPIAIPPAYYYYSTPEIIITPGNDGSGQQNFSINALWSNKILVSSSDGISKIDMFRYNSFKWIVDNYSGFVQDGNGFIAVDITLTTPNAKSTTFTYFDFNFINGDWSDSNFLATYTMLVLQDDLEYTGYGCTWSGIVRWQGYNNTSDNGIVVATLGYSPVIAYTVPTIS